MSNITSHKGASARANTHTHTHTHTHTQTLCWTPERAFMVLKTSVTWHLGQTLSNKAIAAHCLDPPPGTVCLSDAECLGFLTSASRHVTFGGLAHDQHMCMHTETLAQTIHMRGKHWIHSCTLAQKHRPTCICTHATLQTSRHVSHSVFRASVSPEPLSRFLVCLTAWLQIKGQ